MKEAVYIIGWILFALIAAALIFGIVAGKILPEVPDFICDFVANIGIDKIKLAGCA